MTPKQLRRLLLLRAALPTTDLSAKAMFVAPPDTRVSLEDALDLLMVMGKCGHLRRRDGPRSCLTCQARRERARRPSRGGRLSPSIAKRQSIKKAQVISDRAALGLPTW
jgi:hypothetical protein